MTIKMISVWRKRASSPISVLEIGRAGSPMHHRWNDDFDDDDYLDDDDDDDLDDDDLDDLDENGDAVYDIDWPRKNFWYC